MVPGQGHRYHGLCTPQSHILRIDGGRKIHTNGYVKRLGDGMNPGYLSYLLISIVLILLASGWKDILLRGISHKTILLFFILWLPASFLRFRFYGQSMQGVLPLLAVTAAAGTLALGKLRLQLHVWTSGILLGMFDLILLEMSDWLPVFTFLLPAADSALVLAFIAMLLGRAPLWQLTALTGALLIGETFHRFLHATSGTKAVWGGPGFQDRWWLVVCLTRGLTVTFEYGWRTVSGMVKGLYGRRKEWRK